MVNWLRVEIRGQRSDVRARLGLRLRGPFRLSVTLFGFRAEIGKARDQRSEIRAQMSEVGDQKPEIGGQRSENQRLEVGGQKKQRSEGGRRSVEGHFG